MIYLLVFSMAATKLPNYVLPAYPAFALIFACAFDAWLASPSSYSKLWYRGSLGVLIFVGALLGLAIPVIALFAVGTSTALGSFDLAPAVQRELAWLGMLGLPALFGGCIALYLAERNKSQSSFIALCASAIATVACLWNFIVPQVGHHQGPQRMINEIRGNPNLRAADIATFDFFRPTMVFYSGSAIRKCFTSQQVLSFFSERPSGVLVVDSSRLDELKQVLPQDIQIVHRIDRFPESGNLIALHRPPVQIPLAQVEAANLSTEKPAKR
jgi:4-amino-4-deoxy-L-arabinose transferase-like glycosyltransferase